MEPVIHPPHETLRDALIGVLYAEDFDADDTIPVAAPIVASAPPPEPEVIEPTFSADDLAMARDEARLQGRTEAEHGLAAARVRMLDLIAAGLADAREAAAAVAEARADTIGRIMLSAMVACLPALCSRHGAIELRALVQAVLPELVDEPRITVRVNPQMAAAMNAEITALDPDLAERIVLLPTDAMPPGDARITWQDGQAIRDAGQARRLLEDALAALGLLEREMTDA